MLIDILLLAVGFAITPAMAQNIARPFALIPVEAPIHLRVFPCPPYFYRVGPPGAKLGSTIYVGVAQGDKEGTLHVRFERVRLLTDPMVKQPIAKIQRLPGVGEGLILVLSPHDIAQAHECLPGSPERTFSGDEKPPPRRART